MVMDITVLTVAYIFAGLWVITMIMMPRNRLFAGFFLIFLGATMGLGSSGTIHADTNTMINDLDAPFTNDLNTITQQEIQIHGAEYEVIMNGVAMMIMVAGIILTLWEAFMLFEKRSENIGKRGY